MIVIGAVFAVVLDVASAAPLIGLLAAIFSAGYFTAFYFDIISTTIAGRDEVPDWPSFSSFWEDILLPFFRVTGVLFVSFLPTLGVALSADTKAEWFPAALWSTIIFGVLYFPMAVLGIIAFGNLGGSFPNVVLPAILKALPGYLLAVAGMVVAFVGLGMTQEFAGHVPYVGWLLASAVALYSLMFQARLLGLIYLAKREQLGWE